MMSNPAPRHQQVAATELLLARSQIDDGLVAATLIELGRAIIVIVEDADGILGIGNVVQSRVRLRESAIAAAFEHAVLRRTSLRAVRAEQKSAMAEARAVLRNGAVHGR